MTRLFQPTALIPSSTTKALLAITTLFLSCNLAQSVNIGCVICLALCNLSGGNDCLNSCRPSCS